MINSMTGPNPDVPTTKSTTLPRLDRTVHKCYETGKYLGDDKIWTERWMTITGQPLEIVEGFNGLESYIISLHKNRDEERYKDNDQFQIDTEGLLDLVFNYGMINLVENYYKPPFMKNIYDSFVTHAWLNGHLDIIKYMRKIGRRMAEHTFGNYINAIVANGHLDVLEYIHSIPEYNTFLQHGGEPVLQIQTIIREKILINDVAHREEKLFIKPIGPTIKWLIANKLIKPITLDDIEFAKCNEQEIYSALTS